MLRVSNPRILLSTCAAVLALSPIYYSIARWRTTPTSLALIFTFTSITAVSVLAGYELLFAVQQQSLRQPAHILRVALDEKIPFSVHWVWVYSLLYYGLVGLPLAFLTNMHQCLLVIVGGASILFLSVPVFLVWPTACPGEWRNHQTNGHSARLLAFIQRLDNGRACFPSLHCALAAYAATLLPSGWFLLGMPAVVGLSCLFVKQHSVVELPASFAFGFLIGALVNAIL